MFLSLNPQVVSGGRCMSVSLFSYILNIYKHIPHSKSLDLASEGSPENHGYPFQALHGFGSSNGVQACKYVQSFFQLPANCVSSGEPSEAARKALQIIVMCCKSDFSNVNKFFLPKYSIVAIFRQIFRWKGQGEKC